MKTRLTLLVCCAVVATLDSQRSNPGASSPPFTAAPGAFIAISVANLDASVQWYSEKLGLQVTTEQPRRENVAFALLEGGGLIVELIQHDDARPVSNADRQLQHGLFKAGLIVDVFDAVVARLRARGVEIAYGPFPARSNQRANMIVRDHVGNLIQFFGSAKS